MYVKNKFVRGILIFVSIVTILGMIAPIGFGLGV